MICTLEISGSMFVQGLIFGVGGEWWVAGRTTSVAYWTTRGSTMVSRGGMGLLVPKSARKHERGWSGHYIVMARQPHSAGGCRMWALWLLLQILWNAIMLLRVWGRCPIFSLSPLPHGPRTSLFFRFWYPQSLLSLDSMELICRTSTGNAFLSNHFLNFSCVP